MARLFLALLIGTALTLPAGAQVASWYSEGRGAASGERFSPSAMTAAHRTLPFGTRVRVCRKGCVVVRINDRGPFVRGRDIDLSAAAARAIGLFGVGHVTMDVVR